MLVLLIAIVALPTVTMLINIIGANIAENNHRNRAVQKDKKE